MDLRPKMAREAAGDILRDVEARMENDYFDEEYEDDPDKARQMRLDRYTSIILARLTSHSVDFPKGEHVSTDDPETAEKFLVKYPGLRRLIDICKAEALVRWPEATFVLETHSDPESCHTCWEGQHLTLKIQTGLPFSVDEGSPFWSAREAWSDWMFEDGSPYDALVTELGEVGHLFHTDLQWAEEPE